MDAIGLISAIAGTGIISSFFTWLAVRRQNKANADHTITSYVDKIIDQSNARVAQYEADAARWRSDCERYIAEYQREREEKREMRRQRDEARAMCHALEIKLKEKELELAQAKYDECKDDSCTDRIPPRVPKQES